MVEQEQRGVARPAVGGAAERLDGGERVGRVLGELEAVDEPRAASPPSPSSTITTRRRPEPIISPSVGHGSPTTGWWTKGSSPAASTSAAISAESTWSSMNSVTTSSGLAAIQLRTRRASSRNGVDPVSHRPWHMNRGFGPLGLLGDGRDDPTGRGDDVGPELLLGDGERLFVAAGRRAHDGGGGPTGPDVDEQGSDPLVELLGDRVELLGQEPTRLGGHRHRIVRSDVGDLVEGRSHSSAWPLHTLARAGAGVDVHVAARAGEHARHQRRPARARRRPTTSAAGRGAVAPRSPRRRLRRRRLVGIGASARAR